MTWAPNPDAWRDWLPAQTCPGCDQEHPGQPCPEQEPLHTARNPHPARTVERDMARRKTARLADLVAGTGYERTDQ